MTSCLSWSLLKWLGFIWGNNIKLLTLWMYEKLWVGGWPCVPTLLSVDNIVSGGWLTEGTWGHEIILCQAMCYPDRDREGVTLLWNLPPALQAALPALSDIYTHSVPYNAAFLSNPSHPSCTFIKNLPIPFILPLFWFLKFIPPLSTWKVALCLS